MGAKDMVQAIRNMYKGAPNSSKVSSDKGERPEWLNSMSTKDSSFSYRTSRQKSFVTPVELKDQREGLPIYFLKDKLAQAIMENRILVVIGETGSGKTT